MSLTGKKAPYLNARAVINGRERVDNFSLTQYIEKKNIVLFFYPSNFSLICFGEMHALQEKLHDFEKRDTVVIACSTETLESHFTWLNMPRQTGGIAGITFPVIADHSKIISLNYEVLAGIYKYNNDSRKWTFTGASSPFRATFIIDKKGIIRHQSINDVSMERNVDEIIRLLDTQIPVAKTGKIDMATVETDKQRDIEKNGKSFSNN